MAGGASDYSQSTSESNTLGLNAKFGPFNNGGGIRIPEYFWPVALAIVVFGLVFYFKRKR